jgi:Ca2+/H+ antiporter
MKIDWKKIAPYLVALVVFIGFAVFYCSPMLEGKVLVQGDINNWKGAAQEALEYQKANGESAWWTNSMFGGMPTFQIAGGVKSGGIVSWWRRILQNTLGEPPAAISLYFIGFFLMLICFVSYQVRQSRKANKAKEAIAKENPEALKEAEPMALWKAILLVIVSFLAMVFGANILVEGASNIARLLGVTDRIIGLTIVAIGTSLPELFSSVMAAIKGKTDMAIGNIIGSGTFNILCVIGVSSIITPIMGTNIGFAFDYALMIFLGVLLWLFLRSKHLLERWEGFVLTAIYIAYLAKTIIIG